MDSSQGKNFDYIEKLPMDDSEITPSELKIMKSLFSENSISSFRLKHEVKQSIILVALFILVSLSYIDDIITKFFPIIGNSEYFMLIAKGIIFACSYFIIKNIHLIRK